MSKVVRMYADTKYHNFALYEWVAANAKYCFASDGMGRTAYSNKLQFRVEVLPWPRRLASDSPPRRRSPSCGSISSNTSPSRICVTGTASTPPCSTAGRRSSSRTAPRVEPRSRHPTDSKDQRIAALEQKLQRKHEVLSELMEEHIKLKKELGEL